MKEAKVLELFINDLQISIWGQKRYYKEGKRWYNYSNSSHIYAKDLYELLIKEVKEK